MTTGSCIIDELDIADIGMFILKGGDLDLITYPERKEPLKNDWFELDGEDVDLSEVYFKPKKVTIKFYLNAISGAQFIVRLNAFKAALMASGYRSIYVKEYDRTFTLRYVSCSEFTVKGGLMKSGTKSAQLSVDFMDDDPISQFGNSTVPESDKENDTYVKLNDIELKNFGITVKNIYDTALQPNDPKAGLIQTSDRMTGQVVDVNFSPKKQVRKIVVDCYMKASSLAEFYNNYDALFNNLTYASAIKLTINTNNNLYVYYNSMSGFQKMHAFSSGILIQFTLNLTEVFL